MKQIKHFFLLQFFLKFFKWKNFDLEPAEQQIIKTLES